MQIEGLNDLEIDPSLMVFGDQSPFDSFAMLLLLVELEGRVEPHLLAGRSLVEWFSSLDLSNSPEMNVQQFADLLFNDYLNA
jgi:hypothetical protein